MVRRIFRNTFLLSIMAVVSTALLIFGVLYNYVEKQMLSTLKLEAKLIIHGMEMSGEEYIRGIDEGHGTRITWISPSGDVLYDSFHDENNMENHGQREEIINALAKGEGETVRYSYTVYEKMVYYALRLKDGTILRLANGYDNVFNIALDSLQPISLMLLMLGIIIYVVAKKTAKSIVAPINNIDLESGNIADVSGYEEIKPLLARIRRQNVQIATNMREIKLEHEKRESFRRDFTAGISHELKTPLTSISGISEMLVNGIIRQEDVKDFAENIYKESERLISLVNDIILISKLEEEDMCYQKENICVNLLVDEIVKRLEIVAKKKNVSIRVKGNGEDIYMVGVKSMLEELIYNLCDNAIKYNVEGGSVDICVFGDNNKVRIEVADTGIGVPDEDKGSIFERFYRVDKGRSKAVGGTGLGLSIVKHVAIYHGGSVKVENRPGGGTKMTAVLSR